MKNNRRILVIDDNRAIHDDFRKILGGINPNGDGLNELEATMFGNSGKRFSINDFEMDFALQGQQGLELVEQALTAGRPYAMAFVDVRMPPGWDGVETTARIWQRDPNLQVVICTAYSDYSWDDMIEKLGHSERLVILKKPFDNIEVLQLAQSLTHKWEISARLEQKLNDLEELVNRRTADLTSAISIKNLILENSILGIALVRNRHFVWVNRKLGELLGMPPEQIQGASTRVIYPSDETCEAFGREIYQSLAETGFSDSVLQLRRNGEGLFWCRFIGKVLSPPDVYADSIWMFEDISQRKQAEEKIRLQTSALEAADNGIVITDRAANILWVNAAFERLTGYSAAEAVGKTAALLKSGKHDGAFYKDLWKTIQGGNVWRGEVINRHKDGRCYPEEMTITPVFDDRGEIQNFVAIKQDISQRKKLEQEQHSLELQLRQAQKLESIGQLAAGIAHEINTPIQYVADNTLFVQNSFQSMKDLLQNYQRLLHHAKENTLTSKLLEDAIAAFNAADVEYLFEQVPSATRETLEGVDRVTKIVRAMKEFSHPGSQDKTPANLNQAIETTVTVARNEWKYVADLKLDLDPSLPPVPCYLGEINQCILNLIVNSAHAIADVVKQNPGAKGLITVQTRRDGEFVEIRVGDTGTGISESARPHIFEPFFTTKDVGKGTGQGLSIVYGTIVKRHGGSANFETEAGKGTTFILRLPVGMQKGDL
ncbi:MAG TPA: PAS domain S-box protein [Verrucomicrobiae bacterium]|nr:PAS domain S-box protein [Verrucomicrobiae bacterium]